MHTALAQGPHRKCSCCAPNAAALRSVRDAAALGAHRHLRWGPRVNFESICTSHQPHSAAVAATMDAEYTVLLHPATVAGPMHAIW